MDNKEGLIRLIEISLRCQKIPDETEAQHYLLLYLTSESNKIFDSVNNQTKNLYKKIRGFIYDYDNADFIRALELLLDLFKHDSTNYNNWLRLDESFGIKLSQEKRATLKLLAASLSSDFKNAGYYQKYHVERLDGKSQPGEKHCDCKYFILDLDHDPFAKPALLVYADACEKEYPELAKDIRKMLK